MSEKIGLKISKIVEKQINGGLTKVREIRFGNGKDAQKIWLATGSCEHVVLRSRRRVRVEELCVGDYVSADVQVEAITKET